MAKQEYKKWYASKTMWANVLVVLAGVFTAVAGELTAGSTITGLGLLNIILRYITNSQLY